VCSSRNRKFRYESFILVYFISSVVHCPATVGPCPTIGFVSQRLKDLPRKESSSESKKSARSNSAVPTIKSSLIFFYFLCLHSLRSSSVLGPRVPAQVRFHSLRRYFEISPRVVHPYTIQPPLFISNTSTTDSIPAHHYPQAMDQPDFQLFTSLRYDPLLLSLPANTSSWPTAKPPQGVTTLSSPFYMASFHRDRILKAAEHFNWTVVASKISGPSGFSFFLAKLNEAIDITSPQPLRVRVLLSHEGEITVESNPTPKVSQWNLFPRRLPPPQGQQKRVEVSPLTGGALTLGSGDSLHGDPDIDPKWEIIPDPVRTMPSPYTTYKTTSRDMYNTARERVGIKDMSEKKEAMIISEKDGEIMEGSLTSVFFWRDGKWITPVVESGGQDGTTRRWALEEGLCSEGVVKVDSLRGGAECWISNGVRGFSLATVKLRG
jgi:4-amino-4-deoxychorismate lyase